MVKESKRQRASREGGLPDDTGLPGLFRVSRITDEQFRKFSELIYQKTGIFLKPEKKELLTARLGKRLRACQISSYNDYYNLVVNDPQGVELVHLIDSVSTNFTSFFRETAHFNYLIDVALPNILSQKKGGSGDLLLWSAACSSGEEPYTLAMLMEEFAASQSGLQYQITATDISTKVLGMAKNGVYADERVASMPKQLLRSYFQKGVGRSAGYVRVKPELKRKVDFKRLNLMEDFKWPKSFDVIFCRNVMIYFDKPTQERLVNKFYHCLAPGGFLFVGHSESITGLKHNFRPMVAAVYQK